MPKALARSALQVEIKPRPRILILNVMLDAVRMPAICRRLGADLVLNADPYGAATGGRARVTIAHDLYFKTLPKQISARAALTTGLAYAIVLRGSTRIVTVSDATRQDLTNWNPRLGARAQTIHSAPATSGAAPTSARVGPPLYLLLVGNATPNKNLPIAAQAMALLHAEHPNLQLVHVGRDPDELIQQELDRLGSDVTLRRFTGTSDADLQALYRDAVALVTPSLGEGFCLPILEAQAQGCPVISTNVSAPPEIAGDAALYFSPNDAAALAQQVRKLTDSPDLRLFLVEQGKRNLARFSWARAAEAYEQVLEAAASLRRSIF